MSEASIQKWVYVIQNQQSKEGKQKVAVLRGVITCQDITWEKAVKDEEYL